ncbi:MAG: MinD/ParA family protein [Mycobacterium sp.]|nr:MinD/ParA family protein [Mycobacterium sp.]
MSLAILEGVSERDDFLRDRQAGYPPGPPPPPQYRPGPPPPTQFPSPAQPTTPIHRQSPAPATDVFAAPGKVVKPPPGSGWRLLVYKATFGTVNLGPSAEDRRIAHLEAIIASRLRGHFKVGVLGKGGVGKTSVAASVGSVFAHRRPSDRVVALDADTAFGRLGSRVDPTAHGSYWEVAGDVNLRTFADLQARVGRNSAGLYVLAGEPPTTRRRVLDPAVYREASARLDRHFTISVIDCGSTMDAPVTREALRDLDALIVVSSPWADGAAAAGQTMEWLANNHKGDLLSRTVVVLNDSDGHSDRKTRSVLAQQFARHGQVVIEVPFDPHLRPGGVIDVTNQMSPATRVKILEIAAAVTDHFLARQHRR